MILVYVEDNRTICINRGDYGSLPPFSISVFDAQGHQTAYEMEPGDTLTLTVRRTPSQSDTILLQLEAVGNVFTFSPSDTANLEVNKYSADIELKRAVEPGPRTVWPMLTKDERAKTKNYGNFIVMSDVT